ncbi:hypothetical protein [Salinithrix halophila]|uniref:Uncharacterized protein n=1 Tax=Salinithrix halophila TaxID=1485204 RepID=A0ABV8JHS5_9BACL
MTAPFTPAGFLLGGYEVDEQQPNPYFSLDFQTETEAAEAIRWLEESEDIGVRIVSAPGEDLFLTVTDHRGPVATGEGWKDEMWRIFDEYRRQGEDVLLLVSVAGELLKHPVLRLSGERVTVNVSD